MYSAGKKISDTVNLRMNHEVPNIVLKLTTIHFCENLLELLRADSVVYEFHQFQKKDNCSIKGCFSIIEGVEKFSFIILKKKLSLYAVLSTHTFNAFALRHQL